MQYRNLTGVAGVLILAGFGAAQYPPGYYQPGYPQPGVRPSTPVPAKAEKPNTLPRTFEAVGLASAATPLAEKATKVLREKADKRKFTVLVLYPGEKDGKVTDSFKTTCNGLHGELLDQLTRRANGSFFVVPKGDIDARFGGVSADSLDAAKPKETAELMKKFGKPVDMLVFCRVMPVPATEKQSGRYEVELVLVCDDGTTSTCKEEVGPKDADAYRPFGEPGQSPSSEVSNKFRVEIVALDKDKKQHVLPIRYDEKGVARVVVPKTLGLGTPYMIRVVSSPEQAEKAPSGFMYDNLNEQNRQYLVGVYVDGVNTIYSRQLTEDGKAKYGKSAGLAFEGPKWFMSNPGRQIVVVGDQAVTVNAKGKDDHSKCEIPGFQTNGEESQQFVFGTVRESVAYASGMGVNTQPGTIEVTVFAQKMADDTQKKTMTTEMRLMPAGTKAGDKLPHPVQTVKEPPLYDSPIDRWVIFYHLEGDPAVAEDKLRPLVSEK